MIRSAFTLAGIFLASFLYGQATVVFHENFEPPSGADSVTHYSSSATNTWALSTSLSSGGTQSDSAIASPNDTLTITTDPFSTTGNSYVNLEFDHICKIEAFDAGKVEVSVDGGLTWTQLDTNHYRGASTQFGSQGNVFNAISYGGAWSSGQSVRPDNTWWKSELFDISAIAGDQPDVRVRFSLIDLNGMTLFENEGWFIDNIKVIAAFSELEPPVITMLPPIPQDTILDNLPKEVRAEITDNTAVDSAWVVYSVDGVFTDSVGMTNVSGDIYEGSIPFQGYGQVVSYFVGAVDAAAAANTASSSTYTYVQSRAYVFTNAGATGSTGPDQSDLDGAYAGGNLHGHVFSVNGYQEWLVPQTGDYKVIAYGAEGGGVDASHRGQGGIAEGIVTLNGGDIIYVSVGQAGQYGHGASSAPPGGFGGGGDGGSAGSGCPTHHGSSGGGASDIRVSDTTLSSRIIVAAGGGGGTGDGNESWRCGGGGAGGGGYYGGGGGMGGNLSGGSGTGGTQTAGGIGGATSSGNTDGSLGFGGDGGNTTYGSSFSTTSNVYGGDGGGLEGEDGGENSTSSRADGGGGGSSFIGGLPSYSIVGASTQMGVNEGHGKVILIPLFPMTFAENDAGVVSVDEPDIYCPGANDVVVTISNMGSNQIDSVEIHWTVNGVAQTPYTYVGTLDTAGGTGSPIAQVTLGSYTFTNAPYDIVAWTTNPNGQTDTVNINDTAHATVQSSLPAPTNLSLTGVTGTEVMFDWTGGSSAHTWIYVVVPEGDGPGAGIPVEVTADSVVTVSGLSPLSPYDIYVAELCPGGTDTSAWAGPLSFSTTFYCPPMAYCFNNAGATGRYGPSQSDVDFEYTGTNLDGLVTVTGNGIQQWTVPASGQYEIEVLGAQGGGPGGGKGAKVQGEFLLDQGDVLQILVGQQGEVGGSRMLTGGGGGGSFVVDDSNNPLIIAGGGGGGADSTMSERHGTANNLANDGRCPVGGASDNCDYNSSGGATDETYSPGGVFNTDGGTSGRRGAGGGGFNSDGEQGQSVGSENPGIAFLNGGDGGEGGDADGGFGGGGGARESGYDGGGGGGGYSGGGGATDRDNNSEHVGGGGGSFNSGTNQQNYDGVKDGHGVVIINPLSTGAENDAGVVFLNEPDVFCPGTQDVVVTITNFGINQIDSVEVHWEINGVAQAPYSFTGTLDTAGGSGSTSAQVNLGSYTFTNAPYQLKAWTSDPNGQLDTVNDNDTIHTVIQSNLPAPSGLTVVDSTGTTGTFSWTGGSSAHTWIWVVVPQGNAPGTGIPTEVTVENATATNLSPLTPYDVYVAELCPGGTDTSAWAGPATFSTPFQCPQNAFCFTNAGATGATGPTQSDLNSAYSGTTLDGLVTSQSGIQRWETPHTGDYRITAFGAEGGYISGNNAPAGLGARMEGEFFLDGAESLKIIVGQEGVGVPSGGGTGGGGSFVALPNDTPLIVAAGGSGAPDNTNFGELNGKITNRGPHGGTGNSSTSGGGGGGGFLTDGQGSGGWDGIAFINGGQGGVGSGGEGGFGGGGGKGGSLNDGAGGGGYSGGDHTYTATTYGGGGSYNAGINQSNQEGFREGHGLVIIEPLIMPSGAENDAGVVSLKKPQVFCPGTEDVAVIVQNFGTNQITSLDVEWEINGVAQPTAYYTGALDTIGGSGSTTDTVNLGSYTFTNVGYDLMAWTSNPNGQLDTVNDNDTLQTDIQSNLPAPAGLTVVSYTGTTVTFSWVGGSSAHTWLYVVVPEGNSPDSEIPVEVMVDNATATGLSPLSSFDVYVAELCPGGTDTSFWAGPVNFSTPFECPADAYCFNTAGATGESGPSQSDVNAEYLGTNLEGLVTSNNGIQEFTIPMTGDYRVVALGAQGAGTLGGLGARMSGEFHFDATDNLKIIVGQQGTGDNAGGGGTFVAYANDTAIIVAGGGGGGNESSNIPGGDAVTTNTGPTGGTSGGTGMYDGAGGGGFETDGQSGGVSIGGQAFVNGGQGGVHSVGSGGFGGGASASGDNLGGAGGGGGYSGGDGHQDGSAADGGGSYNAGSNQNNQAGFREGDGMVIIEPLLMPSGVPNDAGVIALNEPSVYCPGANDVIVEIQNFGSNLIDSVEVHWSVDGVNQTPVSFTGTLDTIAGSGSATAEVNLGSYTFTNAVYQIVAWTANPNGQLDTVNDNDTLETTIQSNLPAPTGLTMVDSSGTSGTFSWIGGSSAHTWIYVVVLQGDGPSTGISTEVTVENATVSGLNPLTAYDVYVAELCPGGTDTSAWSGPVSFTTTFFCPPTAYCFTNAGATGRYGPTQSDLDSDYAGTNLAGQVTSVNGIQEWPVPGGGTYVIRAYGAQGGGPYGGLGAFMEGEFILDGSETLRILVGQEGMSNQAGNGSHGGGGGTFVALQNDTPLIVAGGGGGATVPAVTYAEWGYTVGEEPQHGVTTTSGKAGWHNGASSSQPPGSAGTNGNGGGMAYYRTSTGGGGYYTDAHDDGHGSLRYSGSQPQGFLNGGEGGWSDGRGSDGGFGGGGMGNRNSSNRSRGAGGGYSGGGGAYRNDPTIIAGGGGSYNAGQNQIAQSGVKEGHGIVIIEPLFTGAMNDAGVVSLDEPVVFCPGANDVVVTITNFGANQITSVDVEWEINGVAQTPYNFTGTLDTAGGSGSSAAQVTLGSYTFTNAPYDLKVWTANPNGQQDTVNDNDTVHTVIQSSLPAPTGLDTLSITGSEATFSWTGGSSQHSWIYVVVLQGNSPSTGTPVEVTTQSVTATGLSAQTAYDFYVAELCPGGTDTSAWAGPLSFTTSFYCPPMGYCFTSANATGQTGPAQSDVDFEYAGTSLDGQVTVHGDGIQEWVVPSSGTYEITAYGAKGGDGAGSTTGGLGAVVRGEFQLTQGESLYILVGQQGVPSGSNAGGGGGGTFVTREDPSGDQTTWGPSVSPLIIAGGGGGAGADDIPDGNGVDAISPEDAVTVYSLALGEGTPDAQGYKEYDGNEGTPGYGAVTGASTNAGGGGGGYLSNASTTGGNGTPGYGFLQGGQGASHSGPDAGGFGGGGSTSISNANCSAGGGGGYSGGAGGNRQYAPTDRIGGGGGGSFNAGVNQVNQSGVHDDHGMVIIETLSTGAHNDAGVVGVVEPGVFCPGTHDVIVSITNFGINQINSVDVEWEINGVAQPAVTYTGTLDTAGGTGLTSDTVNLGSYTFTNAPYQITTWTTDPNGQLDTVNDNDTLQTTIQSNLPAPSSLSVVHAGGNTATFDWTGGSAAHSWIYVVVPQGNSPHSGTPVHVTVDSATATGLSSLMYYDVYVAELCPGGADTSAWAGPETFKTLIGCPPGAYCFRTAGATGATGPTQSELDIEYLGTNLQDSVVSVNGYQRWVVPQSGDYTITTYGAAGGGADTTHMGFGGMAEATATFMTGDTLYITVGQAGQYGHGMTSAPEGGFGGGGQGGESGMSEHGSSGGGASDIRLGDTTLTSRIIVGAGGGGGTGNGIEVWRRGGGGGGGGGYYGGGGGQGGNESPQNPGQGGSQTSGGDGGGTYSGNTSGGTGYGGHGGNVSPSYSSSLTSNANQYGGDGGGLEGLSGNNDGLSTRAAGGGGGSSFIGDASSYPLVNAMTQTGVNDADGFVVIDLKAPPAPHDAGVVAITKPIGNFFTNPNVELEVVVRNFGIDTIHLVDIEYYVNNAPNVYTHSGTIDPLTTDTVSLPMISLPYGNVDICAYTNLAGDTNPANDGMCRMVHRQATVNPPYFDDFEVRDYFMQDTASDKTTSWEFGTPAGFNIVGAYSGNNAWMTDLTAKYDNMMTDMLYSPRVALTSQGLDSLVFWHYYDTDQGDDGGYVQYQNITGNWTTLGTENDPTGTNWYNETIVGQPAFSGNSGGWVRSAICIDSAHVTDMASITQFRFVFNSGSTGNNGDGWAIDNFQLKIPQSPYDAGVTQITSPLDSTVVGEDVTVTVDIRNYGTEILTDIPVSYRINNQPAITETWTGTLASGATTSHTFSQTYTAPGTDYQFCAYTEHPQDGDHTNDSTCRTIYRVEAPLDAGVVDLMVVNDPNDAGPDTTWQFRDVTVQVEIHNFGSDELTAMDVEYQRGTMTPVTESWSGTLLPDSSTVYTFNQSYTSPPGTYTLCGRTLLTGDADPSNDEYCRQYIGVEKSVEYSELEGFMLYQNRPNPTASETHIDFEVPYGGQAVFEVTDLYGRSLKRQPMSVDAGSHTLEMDVNHLSPGVYYYSITFDGYRLMRKMSISR